MKEITIREACDSFEIQIDDKLFTFYQESTHELLADMFLALGFKSTYEEVY